MRRLGTICFSLLVFMWANHDFIDGSYPLDDWIKVINVALTNLIVLGIVNRIIISEQVGE